MGEWKFPRDGRAGGVGQRAGFEWVFFSSGLGWRVDCGARVLPPVLEVMSLARCFSSSPHQLSAVCGRHATRARPHPTYPTYRTSRRSEPSGSRTGGAADPPEQEAELGRNAPDEPGRERQVGRTRRPVPPANRVGRLPHPRPKTSSCRKASRERKAIMGLPRQRRRCIPYATGGAQPGPRPA